MFSPSSYTTNAKFKIRLWQKIKVVLFLQKGKKKERKKERKRKRGREEGRKEGREEGRREGRKEGRKKIKVHTITGKWKKDQD